MPKPPTHTPPTSRPTSPTRSVISARGRMSGQYRHRERYRNLKGPWFDWLFVSRDEMQDIVAGTGWEVTKFIEPKGAQYVAIIEKT